MKKKQQYRKSTINNTNASQQNSGEVLNSVNYQTLLEDYLNKISFSNRQFIDELKTEHNKKLKELENKVSSLEQTNHVQQQDISRLNILLEQKNIEENRNLERMISYQLGYALINACKSFSGFISLPSNY